MIITERRYDNDKTPVDTNTVPPTPTEDGEEVRDANGMTRDDIFDQLEDDDRVVTSGRGSRIAVSGTDGGTSSTGYSAGVGSGTSE